MKPSIINRNQPPAIGSSSKQPTRTTKLNQKLVVFPTGSAEDLGAAAADLQDNVDTSYLSYLNYEEEGAGTKLASSSLAPTSTLTSPLQRVTGYCTGGEYNLTALREYIEKRRRTLDFHPKRIDEVLYCPYFYGFNALRLWTHHSASPIQIGGGESPAANPIVANSNPNVNNPISATMAANGGGSDSMEMSSNTSMDRLIDDSNRQKSQSQRSSANSNALQQHQHQQPANEAGGDLFFFDYGVVVFWGLSEQEETAILKTIEQFCIDPLPPSDWEVENLQYCYDPNGTARIFNDVITLRQHHDRVKLTLSHAIAQSVKLTYFEELVDETITSTQVIPQQMAKSGAVPLSRKGINRKIGQLFVIRIQINLVSNVLDTPEIFWAEPKWVSLYKATRTYLEINQRVEILNQRTSVISDLLDMLKDHLTSRQSEILEWIIIILILIEIAIGIIMIVLEARNAQQGH